MTGEVETEVHFLLHCEKYNTYFERCASLLPGFPYLGELEEMPVLLGQEQTAALAAKYITECQ